MSAITYLEGIDKFNNMRLRADLALWLARIMHRCQCLASVEDLNGGKSPRQPERQICAQPHVVEFVDPFQVRDG